MALTLSALCAPCLCALSVPARARQRQRSTPSIRSSTNLVLADVSATKNKSRRPGAHPEAAGQILLPASSVNLGASCTLNVSFRVAAITSTGTIAAKCGNGVRRHFTVRQCAATECATIVFHYELPLKPGRYQLEFPVRDNRAAKLGRADVPTQVPGI